MFLSKYLNITVFYGNAFHAIIVKDVVTHSLEGVLAAQAALVTKATCVIHSNISEELK